MSSVTQLSDNELAQQVRQGAADAFVELSNRYLPLVRVKASSFHSFALEADDLWQEGLLGLFSAAMTYQPSGGATFQTYAGVCISNRIIAAYRSSASLKNTILTNSLSLQDTDGAQLEPFLCRQELDPESRVIAQESVKAVTDHLNSSLSPMEKDVLRLYLNGYKYGEIAEKLSVSVKAAYNAMQRVRKKLKHHLSQD